MLLPWHYILCFGIVCHHCVLFFVVNYRLVALLCALHCLFVVTNRTAVCYSALGSSFAIRPSFRDLNLAFLVSGMPSSVMCFPCKCHCICVQWLFVCSRARALLVITCLLLCVVYHHTRIAFHGCSLVWVVMCWMCHQFQRVSTHSKSFPALVDRLKAHSIGLIWF